MPHLGAAVHNVQPLTGGFLKNWNGLVAIVLALSGVEAIANATGVMKLDPGSSHEQPSVMKTAKPALLWIALEVCFLTAFLGLGMHALGGLHTVPGDSTGLDVDGPGAHGVRDYMLRYMGQEFVGGVFGHEAGHIFGYVVAVVFGLLLLSAVNTAIGGLITVQFLMARDGEMPPVFKQLNRYGVPQIRHDRRHAHPGGAGAAGERRVGAGGFVRGGRRGRDCVQPRARPARTRRSRSRQRAGDDVRARSC